MSEFDDIWKITDYTWKDGTRGKYLVVMYTDGKGKEGTANIFDGEQQHIFQEAYNESLVVGVLTEQSGKWTNVKSAKLIKGEIPVVEAKPPSPKEKPEKATAETVGAKAYPAKRDNKSFALSYAKDLAVAGWITVDKILGYAEVFDRYMNGDITVENEEIFNLML